MQAYPISAYNTSSIFSPIPGYGAFYALAKLLTDSAFLCGTRRVLDITAQAQVPTFSYFDSHIPKCTWEKTIPSSDLKLFGASHASELQYVWNQTVDLPPPNGNCSQTSQEIAISRMLANAWTAMAKNAKPGDVNGTTWPGYSVHNPQGLLVTNSTSVGPINYTICDTLWDPFELARLQKATNTTGSTTTTNATTGTATNNTSSGSATSSKVSNASVPTFSSYTSASGWIVKPWSVAVYMAALIIGLLSL